MYAVESARSYTQVWEVWLPPVDYLRKTVPRRTDENNIWMYWIFLLYGQSIKYCKENYYHWRLNLTIVFLSISTSESKLNLFCLCIQVFEQTFLRKVNEPWDMHFELFERGSIHPSYKPHGRWTFGQPSQVGKSISKTVRSWRMVEQYFWLNKQEQSVARFQWRAFVVQY